MGKTSCLLGYGLLGLCLAQASVLLQPAGGVARAPTARVEAQVEARLKKLASSERSYSKDFKLIANHDVPCGPGPLADSPITAKRPISYCKKLCYRSRFCLGFVVPPKGDKCIFRGLDNLEDCESVRTLRNGKRTKCSAVDGCYKSGNEWFRKIVTDNVHGERKDRRRVRRIGVERAYPWPQMEPTPDPTRLPTQKPTIKAMDWHDIKWKNEHPAAERDAISFKQVVWPHELKEPFKYRITWTPTAPFTWRPLPPGHTRSPNAPPTPDPSAAPIRGVSTPWPSYRPTAAPIRTIPQPYKCRRKELFNPPYDRCSASSIWEGDKIGQGHGLGRLNSRQAWSAAKNSAGQWWQMGLVEHGLHSPPKKVIGVQTQGRYDGADQQRVSAFTVVHSLDGKVWAPVDEGRVFDGNILVSNTIITNLFIVPVKTRYIRIVVQRWIKHISMRTGVLIGKDCIGNEFNVKWAAVDQGYVAPMGDAVRLAAPAELALVADGIPGGKIISPEVCKAVCVKNTDCVAVTVGPCMNRVRSHHDHCKTDPESFRCVLHSQTCNVHGRDCSGDHSKRLQSYILTEKQPIL